MTQPRSSKQGFTLVEILAVIAILGLLFTLAVPMVTKAKASANRTACAQNLRNIALTLRTWVDGRNDGRWPKERGVKFLLLLAKEGEIEGESLKVFTCPGTNDATWPPELDGQWGAGWADWDDIDTSCISYAGRDGKNFTVIKDKEDQIVIASDDNEFQPNHSMITNIVYADGRISQVDVADFADQLPEGTDRMPVGPDSPHEELRKLMVDY